MQADYGRSVVENVFAVSRRMELPLEQSRQDNNKSGKGSDNMMQMCGYKAFHVKCIFGTFSFHLKTYIQNEIKYYIYTTQHVTSSIL